MFALRLAGAVVLGCSLSLVSLAADAPRATLGLGPGVLAAREGDAPWRVLHPGEPLPARCRIETAAAGACLVRLPEGSLHVAPESRLDLDLAARQVDLKSGRVFLEIGGGEAWGVRAGDQRVGLAAGAAAEVAMDEGARPAASAVRGEVTLSAGEGQGAALAPGTTAAWDAAQGRLEPRPQTDAERERLAAWTAPRRPPQGLGQLLVKDAQSGSPVRLNVARYHVHVVLEPPVALVQIDQSFYNPYPRQEEGQFVFNLPQGASVSRFAMYVTPAQLVEGELIERKQASSIYEQIVRSQRDPAILEQIGSNLFKMRVFPIFARDSKRILLDYTVPLETEGGVCRFRLPLLSDLEPIWDFQLTGAIRGAAGAEAVASVSHPDMQFEARPDGTVGFGLRQKSYRPAADFSVSFARKPGAALRSYAAEPLPSPLDEKGRPIADRYSGQEAMYFVAEVSPEKAAGGEKAVGGHAVGDGNMELAPPPADVLVLADTSSSIKDLGAVRRAVRQVAAHLGPQDRLRLVCADVAPRPLHEGWLAPGGPEARAALDKLDQEFALGGTNLHASIRDALKDFEAAPDRRRLVVYVGDGRDEFTGPVREPGDAGAPAPTTPELLNQAGAAFVGLAVLRSEPDRDLLAHLAEETAGLTFDLAGDRPAHCEFFRWLLAGLPCPERVAKVEVEGAAGEDLYYASAWLPGRPLNVFGRTPPAGRVKLSVTLGRGERTRTIEADLPVGKGQDDVFVGRLWAQKRLDQLRRSGFGDEATQRRTIALAQEWSLLSPLTAFLVLETEQDYTRWNIDRRARRRYWKPADTAPQAPLPPEWLAAVTPPEKPKWEMSEEQFRKTVRLAGEALASGDAALAHDLLAPLAHQPLAKRSAEYAELAAKAVAARHSQTLRASLGVQRGLFDPKAARAIFDLRPSAVPLVAGSIRTSADFARRHPYAEKLMQDVPLETMAGLGTLDDLVAMLRERTGGNVVVDRKALADVGIGLDGQVPPQIHVAGKTSLRSAARSVLRQMDLVMIEEPHRLLVTTPEEAESRLPTEVYPVADLLFTDRVAEPGLLADPYSDRQEAARRRIAARLRRPISVDFDKKPLAAVIGHFARFLDDAVMIDRRALDDVGIGTDAPVTASYRDVPAKEALEWILRDLDLDYIYEDEALVVTTPEEAESRLEVRLHSGRGVVYEFKRPNVPPWQQFQGGFGGLGGMGGGMAMGGGMGGMGFGGGMGGVVTPRQTPTATSVIPVVDGGGAGLSSGGDPTAAEEELAPAEPQPALVGGGGAEADFDSVTDQIASLIKPTAWDDVGGPGSIVAFPYTLDIVVAQARDVQEQIEAFLDRLRRLPPPFASQRGLRPANVPKVTPDAAFGLDFDTLIDLITSTLLPTTWDDVGGAGTIESDEPRVALIVSQTAEIHDQIWRLLTLLRRSRYEAVRGARPWEAAGDGPGGLFAAGVSGMELSDEARLAKLPPPKPEEIDALRVRREPKGQWTWRRVEARLGAEGAARDDSLTVRRAGARMEIAFAHGAARIEGDDAAIAWPGLMLVELGTSGEALRQAADAWLPWLPHRSNEEIARLFDVQVVAGEAVGDKPSPPAPLPKGEGSNAPAPTAEPPAPAPLPDPVERSKQPSPPAPLPKGEGSNAPAPTAEPPAPAPLPDPSERSTVPSPPAPLPKGEGSKTPGNELVRLRFVPVGFSADHPETYIEAAFSRADGLPVVWESHVGSKLTARLRFEGRVGPEDRPCWKKVVQLDAAGEKLAEWELVEAGPGVADGVASHKERVEIPALTAGWQGYVQLDRRAEKPAVDPALRRALAAIRAADWPEAVKQLNAVAETHPRHPLVELLYAWCYEHDPALGSRDQALALLRDAAAGPATAIPRFIAEGQFATLTPAEVYALADLQPEASRSSDDCDRLAAAAVAAGKPEDALRHAEAALARTPGDAAPERFARERTRVEALFRLGSAQEAVQAAKDWAAGAERPAEDLATMAEVLAEHAQRGPADELSALALAAKKLTPDERYRLLRRRAEVLDGYRRLETLAEAAVLKPAESDERKACLEALLKDLSDAAGAESAARLAAATTDADLKADLLVRQAELLHDAAARSDVVWEVYRSGRLADERLAWAAVLWNQAEKPERVILACEKSLRAGKRLPSQTAEAELSAAYRAVGRPQDARRAATRDAEPVTQVPWPTPGRAPQGWNTWQSGGGFF